MKKELVLGLLGLLLVGIVAAGASAFGFGFGQNDDIRGAIENNDYEAWKNAMEAELTEENFEHMVQRHQKKMEMWENREEMRQAIENNDYDAYVEAVQSMTAADTLSEVDFNTLVEMHQARQNGDEDFENGPRIGMGPQSNHNGFGMGRW
ncbi:hypothetical protein JW930_02120 [Candidatus Woesearchaeota archaeon]|nr:hypothetical protein [Candidatus Woesearchaeota archaeon]